MSDINRNPFLPAVTEPEVEEVIEQDDVLGIEVEVSGPSSPVHAPRPGHHAVTEVLQEDHSVPVGEASLVGLHGGAGVTTLAMLIGDEVADGGTNLPEASPWITEEPRVVLVARTHARGLDLATEVTTAWSHQELEGLDLVGLILVDDGPKLSTSQRQQVSRLLRTTPHGWHIPWVEAWRTASPPSLSGVRIPRTIKSIRRALGSPDSPKGTSS